MYISIGVAASMLGVSVTTLRRWEKEAYLLPDFRTKGGHRRYRLQTLEGLTQRENKTLDSPHAIAYARVSSFDQKKDLESQKAKLEKYCKANFATYDIISDFGSGLNYRKPGLKKLLRAIFTRQLTHLVLNHKDRLLRFGSEIVFDLCKYFDFKVIILESTEALTFEEELSQDVIELMTVFSARLYGKRTHKNKKARAA